MNDSGNITRLLQDYEKGNREVLDEIFPLVYEELRRLAANRLRDERADHTLQPTALVHEAYLKLIDQTRVSWQNRAHFFGIASQLMRRIVIDHARVHASEKRGGAMVRLSLEDVRIPIEKRADGLIALDEALKNLAEFDERKSKIVEMRFFGGLSDEEIAEVLQISTRTVLRDWKTARLWLYRELS